MVDVRQSINDRHPNFRDKDGLLFLIRCYACDKNGRENYSMAVSAGVCSWCGWRAIAEEKNNEIHDRRASSEES